MDSMSRTILDYARNYDSIKAFFSDLLVDFPGEIEIKERQERGIDVLPATTETFKLEWSYGPIKLSLEASPLDFSVKNSDLFGGGGKPSFRQDTLYWPAKKQDALVFYGWLKDNLNKVELMNINDLRKLWASLGVHYDSH